MNVEVSTIPSPTQRAVTGPEELSWRYILDIIFAQAFGLQCQRLHFVVADSEALQTMITVRQTVGQRSNSDGQGQALAWCVPDVIEGIESYDYVFCLKKATAPSLRILSQYSIWTRKARLWGLFLRISAIWSTLMRDVYMNRANAEFAASGHRPARYHVYVYRMERLEVSHGS
jgi:hypothetical protein